MAGLPAFFAVLLCCALPGQVRIMPRPPAPYRLDPERERPDRVVLKFAEGSGVRLGPGGFRSLEGRECTAVTALLGRHLARTTRLFPRSEEDLDRERTRLLARLAPGEERPAELNLYYLVATAGWEESGPLIDALNELELVEFARPESAPGAYAPCADLPPATPDYRPRQSYLGAAPVGIAYRVARLLPGGRCPGQTVAHIEGSWHLDHEDLGLMTAAAQVGPPPSGTFTQGTWRDHGTACAGIIAADRNRYGVTGLASARSRLLLASISGGVAQQINSCAALCGPGDVFISSFAYVVQGVHAPLTYDPVNYDAVRNATAKGILYAFGAGNTGTDLSDPLFGGRFDRALFDSGGIVVGASHAYTRDKIAFSNHGARVDAHGWGEKIAALGYGDLFNGGGDPRQYYTADFGGTSGAGPMVAGAAAAFWGVLHEQNGLTLAPAQVREALQKYGTPQGTGGKIGPLPDLARMLAAFGLPDGLWLPQDPGLGGTLGLEISGAPGGAFLLLMSSARGRTRLPSGWNRDLLVDLARGAGVLAGSLDGQGQARPRFGIPADPALAGRDLYFQVLDLAPGGRTHATNSLEVWLE